MILSRTFNYPKQWNYLEALKVGQQKMKMVKMLEITEVVLIHYNIVNENYHQNSRLMYTFGSDKSFGQ